MPREAYISISDLAWEATGHPDFEQFKTGYKGNTEDRRYTVVEGVPSSARLTKVIYVFEDESLPEVQNVFAEPPITVMARFEAL
jgi:hypothetical protein